jgi:ABC-type oligopeptide transport system substrate-binding subunit
MNRNTLTKASVCAVFALLFFASALTQSCSAADGYQLSKGQTLYVSAYSNIFSAPKQVPFNLATILSIRNTDMSASITLISADYYDTKGKLIRKYYEKEIALGPLESTYIYIPEDDATGGFGANFIVRWKAAKEVNAPIVECLMIGMKSGQGISFVSPGQVIKEDSK